MNEYTSPTGVFWVAHGKLLAFVFHDGADIGAAKSGRTFNHRKLWPEVCGKQYRKLPYNYFPRGRVDVDGKGRPVVYMNPNIDEQMLSQISVAFGLDRPPILRYDHSAHYRCCLDEGWMPDGAKKR